MEVIRVILSCWLSNTIAQDRKNFRAMRDQDDKREKLVAEEKQQAIKDKYSDLREKYKNKFSPNKASGDPAEI